MAKLTDLPTEILEEIFRQFLSRKLTDHEHICQWVYETGARRRRATLYSLSMVSKAMSKIALPLLYEQLYDWDDVAWAVDNTCLGASIRYLAYTRYLAITFDTSIPGAEEPLSARLRAGLSHLVRVTHLRLDLSCSSTVASTLLLCFARLSGFHGLQSLYIDASQAEDKQHTLFRDVCQFTSLAGLNLYIEDQVGFLGSPEQSLVHLKFVEVSYIGDGDDLSACMALVSPSTLRQLFLPDFDPNPVSWFPLSNILGRNVVWTELEELELPSFAIPPVAFWTSSSAQLPRLRRLNLRLNTIATIKEVLPTIPDGLIFLELVNMEIAHLDEALDLISRRGWISQSLQHIEMDFSVVGSQSYLVDDEISSQKEDFLDAAREAMSALGDLNILLEPKDLVERIAGFSFWHDGS